MNKIFLLSLVLAISTMSCNITQKICGKGSLPMSDNSRTSLDWSGIYEGNLDLGKTGRVDVQIYLDNDLSYISKVSFPGKDKTETEIIKGSFEWNKDGSQIIFDDKCKFLDSKKFLVGENHLLMLNKRGKRYPESSASDKILKKQEQTIYNTHWKLVELYGQPVTYNENDREAFIIVDADKNSISGNGSCNSFGGKFELKEGNRIQISNIFSTMMYCDNMDREKELFRVLELADSYVINGKSLFLHKARMAPLAKFEAIYFK